MSAQPVPYESKICKDCGEVKALTQFYKHSEMADGYLNNCKDCKRKYQTEYRDTNIVDVREYDRKRSREDHRVQKSTEVTQRRRKSVPGYTAAHSAVARALKAGTLVWQPCVVCASEEHVHAHHDDYSKQLDVIWLCPIHHRARHKLLGWG